MAVSRRRAMETSTLTITIPACSGSKKPGAAARAGASADAAAPRQTSRRAAAWWCRGCGCRPSASPNDQIRLGLLECVEAKPLERRAQRVADSGLDLALAIGIADAT